MPEQHNKKKYSIFTRLHRAWIKHVLYPSRIPYHQWHECVSTIAIIKRLSSREQHRLRKLASLFLHEKTLVGAGEFKLDAHMRTCIAAQACLLILNLELDFFDGWIEIIVYEDTFVVNREVRDEAGVVHQDRNALSGEAWQRGPVILSWHDVRPSKHHHNIASNVVLHEFAHKLDMLSGNANGMPPLHKNMNHKTWIADLSAAYENLCHLTEVGHHTYIDAYATKNPGEFFAVITEVFFERPEKLHHAYPKVYQQLKQFYKQDPLHQITQHIHL